jgi:WD40 repeat protein
VNNAAARALGEWLTEHGYTDIFLDFDERLGIAPGERWKAALRAAADRCEVVLCLISPDWLESSWCQDEFALAVKLNKRIFGLIIEPVPKERVRSGIGSEWQLCDLIGPEPFREFVIDGARVAFREDGLRRLRRGLELAGLDGRGFPWPPADEPERAPYRGLSVLESQDAAIFFGRDAPVIRGLDQIRGMAERGVEKLLIILGASGAGKSSFLRAGLLPRLARDDANFVPLPPIRFQDAVLTGSQGLVAALITAFQRLGVERTQDEVKTALAQYGGLGRQLDDLAGIAHVRLLQPDAPLPVPILLLDQAEELFNPEGAAETERFLAILGDVLNSDRRILAIATMRTDRYDQFQEAGVLPEVKRLLFDLPPMPAAEFRSVIEGPARRAAESGRRVEIDPALTEQLIADSAGPDALPLLGFTLQRLWLDHGQPGGQPGGQQGRLTSADYTAMGGVRGSIEAAVSQALGGTGSEPATLALLRAAFIPWLARVDPDTHVPMRRQARIAEIPEASRPLVARFVEARLLVTSVAGGSDDDREALTGPVEAHPRGMPAVEIAHESLLRRWPALLAWLDTDGADLQVAEEIQRAATEWDRNGRVGDWLDHRAERLEAAERVLRRADFRQLVRTTGQSYVAACRARAGRQRRLITGALTVFALVVLAGALGTGWQYLKNLDQQKANTALGVDLAARQKRLDRSQVDFIMEVAAGEATRGNLDQALRLSVLAARRGAETGTTTAVASADQLAGMVWRTDWRQAMTSNGSVNTAWFSPDGSRVVTASDDHTARIWDAATGAPMAVLRGHDAGVDEASFSADGARVVTASQDNTARIWDAATGQEMTVLRGHSGRVRTARFSPDGARVVTASADGTARFWNTTTGAEITVLWRSPFSYLKGLAGGVDEASFSPDGTLIAVVSGGAGAPEATVVFDAASGQAKFNVSGHAWGMGSRPFSPDGKRLLVSQNAGTVIVDIPGQRIVATLSGHQNPVLTQSFSPDGKRIVTGANDGTARVWDAASGQAISVLRGHQRGVFVASFSPDGKQVLTASGDGTARVWDAASGQAIAVLRGHEENVGAASFSPDGKQVLTASRDGTARLWDMPNHREIPLLHDRDSSLVQSASFSSDGERIMTLSHGETYAVQVWNAVTGERTMVYRGPRGWAETAAFSPDGAHIVTTANWLGDDKTARILDVASGRRTVLRMDGQTLVSRAMFSPDSSKIAAMTARAAGFDPDAVRILDAASLREIATLHGGDAGVNDMSFSPDGSRIVTASANAARVWDVANGQEIAVICCHDKPVYAAVFSADGTRIVTGSQDKTVRIWDAATGNEMIALHPDNNGRFLISPDGSRIATAGGDKSITVWDTASGKQTSQLRIAAPAYNVSAMSFSADSQRLLTGWNTLEHTPSGNFGDNAARIWDLRTGREIAALGGHVSQLNDATFSRDGSRAVTASADGTARIWNIRQFFAPPGEVLDDACGHRLAGLSVLTDKEMAAIGEPTDGPRTDVCQGLARN